MGGSVAVDLREFVRGSVTMVVFAEYYLKIGKFFLTFSGTEILSIIKNLFIYKQIFICILLPFKKMTSWIYSAKKDSWI